MAQKQPEKAPVEFGDVAAYFSEEEWKLLHEWQKKLYMNVMKEIQQALASLGPLIAASIFSLRAEAKEDLCPVYNQDSERQHGMNSSSRCWTVKPVAMTRITNWEARSDWNQVTSAGRERLANSASQFVTVKPEAVPRNEEREEPSDLNHQECEGRTESSVTQLFAVKPEVTARLKEFEYSCFTDHPELSSRESIENEAAAEFLTVKPGSLSKIDEWEQPSATDQQDSEEKERIKTFSTGCVPVESHRKHDNARSSTAADSNYKSAAIPYRMHSTDIISKPTCPDAIAPHARSRPEKQCFAFVNMDILPAVKKAEDAYFCDRLDSEVKESIRFPSSGGQHFSFPEGSEQPVVPMSIKKENTNYSLDDQNSETRQSIISLTEEQPETRNMKEKYPHTCSECMKHFTHKLTLQQHQRIHTGERLLHCTMCEKRFTNKAWLVRHHRIHTGEKPFPCNECNKRFTLKTHLQHHLRNHSGDKPFPCTVCKKSFNWNADLQRHLRIHTGEKPFSCTVCKKSFAQKTDLQRHLRIHTGEKPFGCNECKKSFTQKTDLQRHLRIHTGMLDSNPKSETLSLQ